MMTWLGVFFLLLVAVCSASERKNWPSWDGQIPGRYKPFLSTTTPSNPNAPPVGRVQRDTAAFLQEPLPDEYYPQEGYLRAVRDVEDRGVGPEAFYEEPETATREKRSPNGRPRFQTLEYRRPPQPKKPVRTYST